MVFPGSILSTWPPFLSRSRGTRKRGKTFHSREAGSPILDTPYTLILDTLVQNAFRCSALALREEYLTRL